MMYLKSIIEVCVCVWGELHKCRDVHEKSVVFRELYHCSGATTKPCDLGHKESIAVHSLHGF